MFLEQQISMKTGVSAENSALPSSKYILKYIKIEKQFKMVNLFQSLIDFTVFLLFDQILGALMSTRDFFQKQKPYWLLQ